MADAADHELATTASRQLRRADDFYAAARFMVDAGLHPKAGRTTMRLADVFARRMRCNKDGHFAFSIEQTARELGLKRRAILNHALYLRELGLLAYVEHGSKTNAIRTRLGTAWQPGNGYRGTATIFAAVAPRVWDEAMGRRISGTGYTSRVVGFTDNGRAHACREALCKEAKKRASALDSACTPSVMVPQDHRQLQVVGGKKYTPRKRAAGAKNTSRGNTTSRPDTSPAECAQAVALAEQVQREVWWLGRGCARRLGYMLRPLLAAGWTWQSLAAELLTWGVPGYLRDPAAYLRHEFERRRRLDGLAVCAPPALPDERADDAGTRYTAILRRREKSNTPVWRRYAEELRPELRRRLAEVRLSGEEEPPRRLEREPLLRGSDQAFAESLPIQAWADVSPRDIYQARALGLPIPTGRAAPETDQGWLEQMRDHLEAERACTALRAELSNWEAERSPTCRTADA
ncbi:hypothetical protein [Streptomyces sp. BA2]|uniref:hypothetical protein n=1 Tax=Streptomyces sp. BA2 TaxID=436595 RepID=UPI001323FA1E|nr:hypothetical protein [Streptomyces sp. BA2]MWA07882.1 hypothetical protein [Streptomyces sp. BA2]